MKVVLQVFIVLQVILATVMAASWVSYWLVFIPYPPKIGLPAGNSETDRIRLMVEMDKHMRKSFHDVERVWEKKRGRKEKKGNEKEQQQQMLRIGHLFTPARIPSRSNKQKRH